MIARVARLAGVSPLEVLALPPDLYLALEDDVRTSEWGVAEELQAVTLEVLHAIYRQLVGLTGGQRVPVLKVPRPGEEPPPPVVMRPAEFVRQMQREAQGGADGH